MNNKDFSDVLINLEKANEDELIIFLNFISVELKNKRNL